MGPASFVDGIFGNDPPVARLLCACRDSGLAAK